jgi:hypothetical protein
MMNRLLSICLLATGLIACATPARADRDAVQFGSNIHVAKDAIVHDAVCFFCSVNVEGRVNGDIVVFFGDVHLAGDAQHDVVDFFGDVKAADNASIEADLVNLFGEVKLGNNVSVGKDLVVIFGSLRAAESVTVGGDRVVQPGWFFWGPLLVIALVVILIVHEIRVQRRRRLARIGAIPPWQ